MWEIIIPKKVIKNIGKYPDIQPLYNKFLKDLFNYGPYITWYPHYGRLNGKKALFHCHLNVGHPRYVAVWELKNKKN